MRRLTFKGISSNCLIVQSLQPKKVIPIKKTFTTFFIDRLALKFSLIEKKIISHWPVCEFRIEIEVKRV